MNGTSFHVKPANRFLPQILLVGLGIGTANYIMNDTLNWIQWGIQALATSFIIGYTLVVIGVNKTWFLSHITSKRKLYLLLSLLFFIVGILATEIEHLIRSLIFKSQPFALFSSGKMYLFNGIISLILGFSFFYNFFPKTKSNTAHEENDSSSPLESSETLANIPVKQGENILIIAITDVAYFEAYGNYSFVHSITGEKRLCDYSLLFLERRLHHKFSRVHRKYIINENHIKRIKPHLNSRYVIEFGNGLASIISSKGYVMTIRKLIKIE